IQTLLAESAFGNKLLSPMNIQIPTKWVSQGLSIYSIIATTSGSLNSIYTALIIPLTNVAPHFKNLSIVAS
ncbi:uncharacterized protein EDB91DRAFT_1010152, partial [Suillus paluster]|uniref:uncharacterized protein n=1 Tax=Suillus paluster TaxID=48578 RepID=UPI001B85D88E